MSSNSVLFGHSFNLTIRNDYFSLAGAVRGAIIMLENKTEIVPMKVISVVTLSGSRITYKETSDHVCEELTDGVF